MTQLRALALAVFAGAALSEKAWCALGLSEAFAEGSRLAEAGSKGLAEAGRRDAIGRRHEPSALAAVLKRMESVEAKSGRPIVLFDIDDTLSLAEGRNRRIVLEFARDPSMRARFGAKLDRLEGVLTGPLAYALSDTLAAYGVTEPEIVSEAQKFWKPRFFHNDYLTEDPAVPGASEYLWQAQRRGIVIYITGRWEEMRPGTEALLRKRGFPMPDGKTVFLFMKPQEAIPDAEYKDAKLAEIPSMGEVVGGFENEPKNANVFKKHFPDSLIVFLDTKHSGAKDAEGKVIQPAPGIPWVADFLGDWR